MSTTGTDETNGNEQGSEQQGTNEPTIKLSGEITEEKKEPLLSAYKPITIRAKAHTRKFFDDVEEFVTKHNVSAADAVSKIVAELYDMRDGANAQMKIAGQLGDRVSELQVENDNLKKKLDEQATNTKELADNEFLVEVTEKELKLFRAISAKRFANKDVRKRYKLSTNETVGELLVNCIRTQEILFDHNNCFYTGLTKKDLQ